jgi:hypothetical protein
MELKDNSDININNNDKISVSELPSTAKNKIPEKTNRRRMIFVISAAAIILITGLASAAFFFGRQRDAANAPGEQKSESVSNALESGQSEFSYSECKGQALGGNFFSNTIKEAKWEDDNLIVKATSNHNCEQKKLSGKSEVQGNKIILDVEAEYGTMMAMCDCDYDVEFKIGGLTKSDYNISFNSYGKEIDWLDIRKDGTVSDMCDQDRSYSCYSKNIFAVQYPRAQKNNENKNNNQNEKEIVYDTAENKRIAETNPDFLRLLKKYEHYDFESDSYNTIYLSYDKETKNIKFRAGYKGDETNGSTTWLVSEDINSFQEGVNSYVAEKKSIESPNSLEAQLKSRLSIEITRGHENEAGFDFVYNGENLTYSGPFDGYPQKGNLTFGDRKGGNIFRFLEGFPQVSQLDNAKLMSLIDISNKAYQPIKNNAGIDISSIYDFTIKPSVMIARFSARTNPEVENNPRHMTIHSFDIIIKDPIQKKYELNIGSGELKILTVDENVDEF